jgi:hypothetical protein
VAALAEGVVHPDQRDLVSLEVVDQPANVLGHPGVLGEGRQEDVVVALLGDDDRLRSGELRYAGLLGDVHVGHGARAVHRAEDRERLVVEHAPHDGHRGRRIGLRVLHRRLELHAEDAALLVDVLDGQVDGVAPHRADARAAAGDLGNDRDLDDALRASRRHGRQDQERREQRKLQSG